MPQTREIPGSIFRAYDIRGLVDEELAAEVVHAIGLGYGTLMRSEQRTRIAVGLDQRASSPGYADALVEGLRDAGIEVTRVGVVPTPVLSHAVARLGLDGSIMVTGGSHPIEYNGLKLTRGVRPIWGDEIWQLRDLAAAAEPTEVRGDLVETDVIPDYLDDLAARFSPKPGLRVIVDCAHGTAASVALPLFEACGIQVDALHANPDGRSSLDPADDLAELGHRVRENEADLGLAFAGDRLALVDESGTRQRTDHLLLVLARHFLKRQPGAHIVADLQCSDAVLTQIAELGGMPILCRSGTSIIQQKMREERAALGGEMAGHFCVALDYHGFDDAFHTALLILQILSETDGRCSALFEGIPPRHSTPELELPVEDDEKFKVMRQLIDHFQRDRGADRVITLDGVRTIEEDGWMLIRTSSTTPHLTVRVEGHTPEALQRLVREVVEVLQPHPVETHPLEPYHG